MDGFQIVNLAFIVVAALVLARVRAEKPSPGRLLFLGMGLIALDAITSTLWHVPIVDSLLLRPNIEGKVHYAGSGGYILVLTAIFGWVGLWAGSGAEGE